MKDLIKGYFLSAVTWKDTTIVLGKSSEIYLYEAGRWCQKTASGDAPYIVNEIATTVLGDAMYVLGGCVMHRNSRAVYSLNLITWEWTQFGPNGHGFTLDNSRGVYSWSYNGDIYLLGVLVWLPETWGLFRYNISTNYWEKIDCEGDIPSIRYRGSTVLSGDAIFLFGGKDVSSWLHLNDLFMLDLTTMKWKMLHASSDTNELPSARKGQTLTPISRSKGLLIGGGVTEFSPHMCYKLATDCWLLDFDEAKKGNETTSMWKQINVDNFKGRISSRAILEPVSQRLMLIGGFTNEITPPEVQKIAVNVVPLQILSMECAAENIPKDDSRLKADKFPDKLLKDIEAFRSK